MESLIEWRLRSPSKRRGASNSDYPVSSSTFARVRSGKHQANWQFRETKKLRSREREREREKGVEMLWGLTISVKGADAKPVVPLNDSRAMHVTRALSRWNYMKNYDYILLCVCVCVCVCVYIYILWLFFDRTSTARFQYSGNSATHRWFTKERRAASTRNVFQSSRFRNFLFLSPSLFGELVGIKFLATEREREREIWNMSARPLFPLVSFAATLFHPPSENTTLFRS